jgi:Fe2+ or Zn2+ uptake regulation protein
MTEITKYICDMCGAVQELNISERWETNYLTIRSGAYHLSKKDPMIYSLCPSCANSVGKYILEKKKDLQLLKK